MRSKNDHYERYHFSRGNCQAQQKQQQEKQTSFDHEVEVLVTHDVVTSILDYIRDTCCNY